MTIAYADCRRCGEPAHPTRGYCGRYCEEATAADEAMRARGPEVWRKPGLVTRIANIDAPPRDAEGAFAEAYAALVDDTLALISEDNREAWARYYAGDAGRPHAWDSMVRGVEGEE